MEQAFTTMRDLIRAFAAAMNFIEPEVEGHHEQVTYLAARLAEELEFSGPERNLTFYGALLHDVGSVMMRSGRSLRELEADGIVIRTVFPEVPPRVEYSLSELGETMRPVLDAMQRWGEDYKKNLA